MVVINQGTTNNPHQTNSEFSVAICVYQKDHPEHFQAAVESVLNQTIRPAEVVLVVDGPIPAMIDAVIQAYEGRSFFKVIRLSRNVGHGNARRTALANCSHELIALMDADDLSVPDRFERQLACFAQDENLSIVGSNIKEFVGSVANVIGIREVPQDDKAIKHYLKKRCPFNQMTVMLKHSVAEEAGGYLDWYCNEDYYLWIRMFQKGAIFKNLPECLVNVRVGEPMYQRRGGWRYFQSEAKLQAYLLQNEIINFFTYVDNVIVRLVVQVLLPSMIRGFILRYFARRPEIVKGG